MNLCASIKALKALEGISMHPFRRFQRFQQPAQGGGRQGWLNCTIRHSARS